MIFFVNIRKKQQLANKLVSNGQIFTDFLKHNFSSQLKFMDIDKEHIMKIIDNMKSKTSCGFDGISMKIVKSIKKKTRFGRTIDHYY